MAAGISLATGCAIAGEDDSFGVTSGKADTPGLVPADSAGTWSREVVADNASLWNGGPTEWGAGTTIAMKTDGSPMIAYYDATYRCNNGGWGTYSPDALMTASRSATGWSRRIEGCGPETGYWPRLRIDDSDRAHLLFGAGWYTKGQRAFYIRLSPTGQREVSKLVDGGYMSPGALALTLDATGAPVVFSDGKLVADDGTKVQVFDDSSSQTYAELDAHGELHVIANTMVPDPNDPSTSHGLMRYAHRGPNGVTIEAPRSQPVATPLGLVIDSQNQPHILSWNTGAPGQGELWHSTRTQTGWVDELIANDVWRPTAALALGAGDELLVVSPGKVYRRGSGASGWTTTTVPTLSPMSHPSMVVASDGSLHVAFEIVGPTMSNSRARASVYHATFDD
jgi:hypothetical protein